MVKKLIINADDLGFSKGVNQAILKAHNEGFLSHASLMANTEYFDDAVKKIIPQCRDLKVGLHVNLTCGKSLFTESVLAEKETLNNTFLKLLFLRKSKKVLQSLENEIELQLLKLKENNIEISHIDGHEHIHIIPSINKIIRKLAEKYSIKRVREINEGFFESFKYNGKTTTISNIIKLILLKFLSLFNEKDGKVGFYSMLNTCEINERNLFEFLKKSKTYGTLEIMLHPAIHGIDDEKYLQSLSPRFISFFQDKTRKEEFELCFDKRFENYKTGV